MKLYLSENKQYEGLLGDIFSTEKTQRVKDANKAYDKLIMLLDGNAFYNEISAYGVDESDYKYARNRMLLKLNELIPAVKSESCVVEKLTLFDFASTQDNMRDCIRDILVAMYKVDENKTKECIDVVNDFLDVINKEYYISNKYTPTQYEIGVHFTEKDIKNMSNNY